MQQSRSNKLRRKCEIFNDICSERRLITRRHWCAGWILEQKPIVVCATRQESWSWGNSCDYDKYGVGADFRSAVVFTAVVVVVVDVNFLPHRRLEGLTKLATNHFTLSCQCHTINDTATDKIDRAHSRAQARLCGALAAYSMYTSKNRLPVKMQW